MFVARHSPRGSFTIPVNINLQGARRRQTRAVLYQVQEPQRKNGKDWRSGERSRPQALLSSVGDERAVFLGFAMLAFSILMYFVVGIAVVKPHLRSDWSEETNCSLVQAEILDEWADCRGVSRFRCVRVFVNVSSSGRKLRLHYDEGSVDLNLECFYAPKCQRNESDLLQEAQKIKQALDKLRDEPLRCRFSAERHPEDAILHRKYSRWLALGYLLWPSLMLSGGVTLVGLVKLNQRLAHLCAELEGEAAEEDGGEGRGGGGGGGAAGQTALVNGKLYQLLGWRLRGSGSSPQEPTG
ncbi:calcium-activated potassium channel subunit beta-3 [Engraulis encrasicolus]|uniref:calcium-activated potassium channel subunit beta-3 n=1 Tax=Engraulis encrasicolus TaxID=184585 RepID=UPI002FCF7012